MTRFTQATVDHPSPSIGRPFESARHERHGTEGGLAAGRPGLAQRLDWVLQALPVTVKPDDPTLRARVAALDPSGGLVLRRLRLADGRVIHLIAVPARLPERERGIVELRRLQRRLWRSGALLRLVGEAVVDREPRLGTARLIAAHAGRVPSRRSREILRRGLGERGGSATVGEALGWLEGERDGFVALLALLAQGAARLDLDRPFGAASRLSLGPLAGL